MVSVVTGNGNGLINTSKDVLGGAGGMGQAATGRAGEQITVNAANGNLVIQDRDEYLVGVGPDVDLLRTYNSQGGWDGDNGDGWRVGYYRRVSGRVGTVNTAGSSIKRTDADGHEASYAFDTASGKYFTAEGSGQFDSLSYSAGVWTWTDGDTGTTETYANVDGEIYRLNQITDAQGNFVKVDYDGAGLISSRHPLRLRQGWQSAVRRQCRRFRERAALRRGRPDRGERGARAALDLERRRRAERGGPRGDLFANQTRVQQGHGRARGFRRHLGSRKAQAGQRAPAKRRLCAHDQPKADAGGVSTQTRLSAGSPPAVDAHHAQGWGWWYEPSGPDFQEQRTRLYPAPTARSEHTHRNVRGGGHRGLRSGQDVQHRDGVDCHRRASVYL
ncbi:DUF6531 domain-containing protein [Pelomonas sp. Root1217]|uniref:DUF6531 domain-containing protein n=1 Tax=Pelomonas sp. Root1217 TaxID=1736430 RepID=UPI0012FAF8C3|nr:DUF6531 domain-containing protein [Pelomonas sp. Root1217]